jgi:hypothetical protein
MGNQITANVEKGTLGELFCQIRLLEYGVQSSFPLKDSGNDLVAIHARTIKLIQVKTTSALKKPDMSKVWDLYLFVELEYNDDGLVNLGKSVISVYKRPRTGQIPKNWRRNVKKLTREEAQRIWNINPNSA